MGIADWRTHTEDGRQIVTCGRYAYTWPAEDVPLAVGDRVVLPPNWLFDEQVSTVTGLGTDYDGPLVAVLRRATPVDVR